jgi:hypothetical protein
MENQPVATPIAEQPMAECSRHLKVEFCQDFLSHDEAVTAVIAL